MIVLIGFRDTKAEYHLAYERGIGDLCARPGKVVSDGEHEIIDASQDLALNANGRTGYKYFVPGTAVWLFR